MFDKKNAPKMETQLVLVPLDAEKITLTMNVCVCVGFIAGIFFYASLKKG